VAIYMCSIHDSNCMIHANMCGEVDPHVGTSIGEFADSEVSWRTWGARGGRNWTQWAWIDPI
jgi:hypothetical protein